MKKKKNKKFIDNNLYQVHYHKLKRNLICQMLSNYW